MSPTVIHSRGWRLHFYMNEGNEPIHIHAKKGEVDCKFWLDPDAVEIQEHYAYNITPALRKEVRKLIYQYFSEIVEAWEERCKQR